MPQCEAMTRMGAQCRRTALAGSRFCSQHAESNVFYSDAPQGPHTDWLSSMPIEDERQERDRHMSYLTTPYQRRQYLEERKRDKLEYDTLIAEERRAERALEHKSTVRNKDLHRKPMVAPAPLLKKRQCVFPDWVHIPNPETGVFARYNTAEGQANLEAIWARMMVEKATTGLYTFRSVINQIPAAAHGPSGGAFERRWAFTMLMANLFTNTTVNCAPALTSIVSAIPITTPDGPVDAYVSNYFQQLEYRTMRAKEVADKATTLRDRLQQELDATTVLLESLRDSPDVAARTKVIAERSRIRLTLRDPKQAWTLDQPSVSPEALPEDYYSAAFRSCEQDIFLVGHSVVHFSKGTGDREYNEVARYPNLLVVDKRYKRVYNFDPHGVSPMTEALENWIRNHVFSQLGLNRHDMGHFKFVTLGDYMPKATDTLRTADDVEFSGSWATWFGTVCMLNPDMSVDVILKELLQDTASNPLDTIVRKWTAFMEGMVQWGDQDSTMVREARTLQCALTEIQHVGML